MSAPTILAANAASAMSHALARGQLVIICGTGVTASATKGAKTSSWQGLIEDGIQRAKYEGIRDADWAARAQGDVVSGILTDMIVAAEKVTAALQEQPGLYAKWLEESVGSLVCEDPSLPNELARLSRDGALLVTTNYDDILADAGNLKIVTESDGGEELRKAAKRHVPAIVHLHGHWKSPSSVVFGTSSYSRIASSESAKAFMTALLYAETIVFVGVGEGLSDPNFEGLRKWCAAVLGNTSDPHYRLAREGELSVVAAQHAVDENIKVVSYGSDYEDLPAFLASLTPLVPTRAAVVAADKPMPSRAAPTPTPLSAATRVRESSERARLRQQIEVLAPALDALNHDVDADKHGFSDATYFEDVLRKPLEEVLGLDPRRLAGTDLARAVAFAQRLSNLVGLVDIRG